jgi:hypothetical protein
MTAGDFLEWFDMQDAASLFRQDDTKSAGGLLQEVVSAA